MPRQGSPSDDGRQRRGYFNWEKSRAGGLLLDWLEDPDNSTRWKTAARACRDGELRGSGPTKNALVNEIVKFLKTNGETGLTTKQVKNKMFNYERSYWAAKKLRKRAAAKEQDADEEDGRVKRPRDVYGVCGEFDRLDTVFGDGSVSGRGTADSESYMEGCSVFSDADAEEASHDLSGAMDDSVDATQTSNEEFRVEGDEHNAEDSEFPAFATVVPGSSPGDQHETLISLPRKTLGSYEARITTSSGKRRSRFPPVNTTEVDIRLTERRLELEHVQRMKELQVREKEADNQNLLLRYLIGQSNLGLPR